MEKRMEEITVKTEKGMIWITEPDYGDGSPMISFPPEQADIIIAWIKEAKEELEAQS